MIHSFYIALFSALEQTQCAHWRVILNEWLYPFIARIKASRAHLELIQHAYKYIQRNTMLTVCFTQRSGHWLIYFWVSRVRALCD